MTNRSEHPVITDDLEDTAHNINALLAVVQQHFICETEEASHPSGGAHISGYLLILHMCREAALHLANQPGVVKLKEVSP